MSDKVKVLKATERAKEIIIEISNLMDQRRVKSSRIRDGILYFKGDIAKSDVIAGLTEVRNLMAELEEIDLAIRDLQTEFSIAAECTYTDVSFNIKVGAHEGEVDIVPAKTITFGAGDTTDISPEDIWFIQIATKLFGSNPQDVTFASET